ncbi:hypothetical protein [Paenibacillus peoriae]|uniref:hypothetical protein n=1 Tax=Paenibacillus peoriae TaxID=59893 RepID=UPI00215A4570|nr:hypothetical protein [Paenibacillus peoriae]QYK69495.1 hypothetical protein KAI36_04682 [Paenibacillus sp. S02]
MIEPLQSLEIPEDSKVTMDEWGLVGSTQKRMKHKLRMMETTDSQGNFLIPLTNRFDLSCDESVRCTAAAGPLRPSSNG